MPVRVSARQVEDATILDVVGEVDLHASPELRKVLLDVLREKPAPHVLMNLQGVTYIDSSGVAVLVEGLKTSATVDGRFALYGLGPEVREVLELTQLLSVFEVYENEQESLRGHR